LGNDNHQAIYMIKYHYSHNPYHFYWHYI